MKTLNQFLDESMGGGVPLTPQELEIQKKMSRLNVRLARKRSQQMQKAKVDDTETAPEQVKEGVGDAVKKGLKRHKDAVEKKKIKNRKAVPYAALAAEHQPEGDIVNERYDSTESGAKESHKFHTFYKKAKEAKAKKQADSTRSDSRRHGIKFSDAKGSGRIKAGKKIYD